MEDLKNSKEERAYAEPPPRDIEKGYLVFVVIASLLLALLYKNCHIEITETNVEAIISLLLTYGVIAASIERFVNKIIVPDSYSLRKRQISEGLNRLDGVDRVAVHDKKFVRLAFYTGILVSALGFRFYANISDGVCTSDSTYMAYIIPLADIFLTGILLSGGSQFVMYIINLLKGNKQTN